VGKAAEAFNDFPVPDGVGKHIQMRMFLFQLPEQRDGPLLVRQIFAVHERHVDEHALDWEKVLVKTSLDEMIGDFAGERVSGEGAGVTTKHVAWELVKKQDECQATARRLPPIHELPPCGKLIVGRKAGFDLLIELLSLPTFS
jgi:hypothetical protein